MDIKKLLVGKSIYDCNCYAITSEKAAIIIDPSIFDGSLVDFFTKNSDKEKLILITHAHPDHILGAEELRERSGVKIGIGEIDAPSLNDPTMNLGHNFNVKIQFSSDYAYADNEEIKLGDLTVKVIHTPGHTKGSVCYLIGNKLFSGDTLFCETVGRTDLPTGSFADMKKSLQRLKCLDGNIEVYPGHGRATTIANEVKYNPYILGLSYC